MENGSNFYLHNTDSIFCPLSQEWATPIPIIKGKEAVNYVFGISTCFSYFTRCLSFSQPESWISMFAHCIADLHVCLEVIFLLTWILCPSVIIRFNSRLYFSLSLSPKCHWTLKMYNGLSVCGRLEYFAHCAATLAPSRCYSALLVSEKVRQWLWIKALRSNDRGNTLSTELKGPPLLCLSHRHKVTLWGHPQSFI